MNEFTRSRLIDLFWEGLTNWDWESWQSAGAEDKETIVTDAIIELGIDIDINDAYDLFWEWADGLDENSFGSEYSESLQEETILESSLTAEEKVDAWHNGTRRENYKAAGEAKLNTYLEIAKSKGYDEIVKIIEGELSRRGITVTASAPVSSTTSAAPVADTAPDLTTSVSDITEEPVSSEAPVEDTTPAVTLSDKDLDALLGMAIQRFGTNVISAYSVWKSAGGFIGSYSLTWRNSSGNPIKSDRAIDKVMDLAYDHNKLTVLVSYFHGGSHSIDRYYSIDVPSSTSYLVDRGTIYKQAREAYSYYDSELNWNFYTLTKNKTNQKKVKIFLLEKVPTLTPEQAEEITTKFFER